MVLVVQVRSSVMCTRFMARFVPWFMASGLDINGCVLSYFEGTANLHCFTSCTLTTLHCSKVSCIQFCHMKIYNKCLHKCKGFAQDAGIYILYIYIYFYNIYYIQCV